jgi:hypothetical protein
VEARASLRYGEAMVPTFIDRDARDGASCELFKQQVEPWPSMNVNPYSWREIGLGSALPGFSNAKSCVREPGSYHAPGSFSFKAWPAQSKLRSPQASGRRQAAHDHLQSA